MNQTLTGIVILFGGIAIGLICHLFLPMLYFVGFILVFILLMGQNQLALRQPNRQHFNQSKQHYLLIAIVGYILAGIICMFV